MSRPRALAMAGLALLLAVPPAVPGLAQGVATSALRGHDSRAPVDVDADRIEVLDRERQALFEGDVRVRQGNLRLRANRVRVSYQLSAGGDPALRRLDADGSVRLESPSEAATARFGIYDAEAGLLTLIGDVELRQGATEVRGNRLVINLENGRSTLDGGGTGAAGSRRVSGRFTIPPRPG